MEIKSVQTQTELMTLNERVIIEAFNHKIEVKLVFKKTGKGFSYDIKTKQGEPFHFVQSQNPDLTKAVAYAIHAAACRAEELIEQTKGVDDTPNEAVLIPKTEDTQENKGYQYIDFKNIKDPTIGKGSVSLSTIKIYMDMDLSDEEIYNNFKSNKYITIEAIQEAVNYLKTQQF